MILQTAKGSSISDDESLKHLYKLACRNYNYSSAISEEEVLKLCQKMEVQARSKKDYENLFFIQQITVNSYCLKGDIGLAVSKAQQMYEEAKRLKLNVGGGVVDSGNGQYIHVLQSEPTSAGGI